MRSRFATPSPAGDVDHELALKLQSRLASLSIGHLERLSASNPDLVREWVGELQAERDRALAEANRLSTAIDRLILAGRRSIKPAAE